MMDTYGNFSVSDKVSMCNYQANRLCCEAADQAMQVHGGLGYSRHKPSNTSIGIIVDIGLPRAPKKSRFGGGRLHVWLYEPAGAKRREGRLDDGGIHRAFSGGADPRSAWTYGSPLSGAAVRGEPKPIG